MIDSKILPESNFIHSFIHTFIHSFKLFPRRLFKSTTTQRRSRHSTDTVPEFHAEAPQATVSEGLAQGPCVSARAGDEPMTLRTKGVDSTNTPISPSKPSTNVTLRQPCKTRITFYILINKLRRLAKEGLVTPIRATVIDLGSS